MSHYLLEMSVTKKPSPFTTFYYPPKMFSDTQTTLNVLVTLEDAFIAAYLVGVRRFSNPDLRVTAARIMGIESDHRTLARVLGPDVAANNGGPIETITGVQGKAESVDPPNNNGYERTLRWTKIEQAVAALTPFADKAAAAKAGFDTSQVVPVQAVHAQPAERARRVPLVPGLRVRRRPSAASAHSRCRGARWQRSAANAAAFAPGAQPDGRRGNPRPFPARMQFCFFDPAVSRPR